MRKKLTITLEYNTDDNSDEYQVLKEELESVMNQIGIGAQIGGSTYYEGPIELITVYKIEDNE